MATKRKPSLAQAVEYFKEVIERSGLDSFFNINNIFIGKNKKGNYISIYLEDDLLLAIREDNDLKDKITLVSNSEEDYIYEYLQKIKDEWIELDSEKLYKGELISLSGTIEENLGYSIPIGKSLLPLKLKKAEFNQISYQVLTENKDLTIYLRKIFEPKFDNCGFTIIRIFKIL